MRNLWNAGLLLLVSSLSGHLNAAVWSWTAENLSWRAVVEVRDTDRVNWLGDPVYQVRVASLVHKPGTHTPGSWALYGGSETWAYADCWLYSPGDSVGQWVDMERRGDGSYWLLFDVNDDWIADTAWVHPIPEGYRRLDFTVTNETDLWRDACVFASEFHGVAWARTRVGPRAVGQLSIVVRSDDTTGYYAAFVDVEQSKNALEHVEGEQIVGYSGVYPVGLPTSYRTAAGGTVVTIGPGDSVVDPRRVPSGPVLPGVHTTTGTAAAVTNEHLSTVGNALGTTVRDGLEGVAEAVWRVEQAVQAGGGGGGSGAVWSAEGIESRLDTLAQKLDRAEDRERGEGPAWTGKHTAADLSSHLASQRGALEGMVESQLAGVRGMVGAGVGGISTPGPPAWPTFELPLLGPITLDPGEHPWLCNLLSVGRELILWAAVVGFVRFALERVNAYSLQVAATPQTTGTIAAQDLIPVAGQVFSWAKGSLSAAVVVGVVVTVVGVGIGMVNSQLGGLASVVGQWTVRSAVEVAPAFAGIGGAAWAMVNLAFPVVAVLELVVAEVVLLGLMGPAFVGASLVVRGVRV